MNKRYLFLILNILFTTGCFAQYATQIGDTTFFSDGSYATKIGDTTFFSNGETARQIGDTTFFSNGETSTRIGDTTFNSDGTFSTRIGDTEFYSDGNTATQIGDTTFFSDHIPTVGEWRLFSLQPEDAYQIRESVPGSPLMGKDQFLRQIQDTAYDC